MVAWVAAIQYNRIIEKGMEELSLEVRGELQQIFKVLSKDEHDKMPFEGIEIAKSLSRLPFFRRFFDTNSEHFINLCIAQNAIVITEGTSVYAKEASEGRERYIYLILEGSFSSSSEESPAQELRTLRIFGQTQILFGLEERKQTVVALQESKVMRIKESAILKIFNRRDDIKKCLHFMEVNEYFQDLKKLEKMQLALSMVRRSFEKDTILKLEGEKCEEVFFFIYGKVEVTTHISKNNKEKEYIIDYLEQLSSFGEFESTTGIGTALKLRGLVAGAYYSLNFSQIKRENHKIARIIEENAIPYPGNEQLQFLEGVKSTLRNQENRVTKTLYSHR